MNRNTYYSEIEERLNLLALRIRRNSSLNLQNLNIHCENFYAQLFNLIFVYSFRNLNEDNQNIESVDLIDETSHVLAQVSSTTTRRKIESTLNKEILNNYKQYKFIFIFISDKDAKKLRKQAFSNPYNVSFNPEQDIYDVTRLLSIINSLEDINKIREIYNFIQKELKQELNPKKIDSDLVKLINILSQEDLDEALYPATILPFEIQKKIDFNGLGNIKTTISDNAIYSQKLNEKYDEFDRLGVNKSRAILNMMKSTYLKLENQFANSVEVFNKITEILIKKIESEMDEDTSISKEELELYVQIIVVDGFMKCKIFKNPEEYKYAAS